jgi:hypothetical protein
VPKTYIKPCKTFEEAVKNQKKVHARLDEGNLPKELLNEGWRKASLKEGYEVRAVLEHGTGRYPVNIATGEVCQWKGKWSDDGAVLLCQDCFEDGT